MKDFTNEFLKKVFKNYALLLKIKNKVCTTISSINDDITEKKLNDKFSLIYQDELRIFNYEHKNGIESGTFTEDDLSMMLAKIMIYLDKPNPSFGEIAKFFNLYKEYLPGESEAISIAAPGFIKEIIKFDKLDGITFDPVKYIIKINNEPTDIININKEEEKRRNINFKNNINKLQNEVNINVFSLKDLYSMTDEERLVLSAFSKKTKDGLVEIKKSDIGEETYLSNKSLNSMLDAFSPNLKETDRKIKMYESIISYSLLAKTSNDYPMLKQMLCNAFDINNTQFEQIFTYIRMSAFGINKGIKNKSLDGEKQSIKKPIDDDSLQLQIIAENANTIGRLLEQNPRIIKILNNKSLTNDDIILNIKKIYIMEKQEYSNLFLGLNKFKRFLKWFNPKAFSLRSSISNIEKGLKKRNINIDNDIIQNKNNVQNNNSVNSNSSNNSISISTKIEVPGCKPKETDINNINISNTINNTKKSDIQNKKQNNVLS